MMRIATFAIVALSASSALANPLLGTTPAVPEIDAMAGVAALAAVGAAVALIRERSKR